MEEVMSAFNRAWREKRCSKSEMELVGSEFLRIWPSLHRLELKEPLMHQAGQLIFKHSPKGFDAGHLASAILLKDDAHGDTILFSCFDISLNRAAQKEGFKTHQ
jgi:hypothetical protein